LFKCCAKLEISSAKLEISAFFPKKDHFFEERNPLTLQRREMVMGETWIRSTILQIMEQKAFGMFMVYISKSSSKDLFNLLIYCHSNLRIPSFSSFSNSLFNCERVSSMKFFNLMIFSDSSSSLISIFCCCKACSIFLNLLAVEG
jgi:hypothetical protein